MLTDNDMQELLEYRAQHPVLSVYLDTSPLEGNADDIKLRLRGMLKDVDLPGDVESVLRFLITNTTGPVIVLWSSPASRRTSSARILWRCLCAVVCACRTALT